MENDVPVVSTRNDNQPSILREWMMGNLEGRLLTMIEIFGFDEKRETAVKSMVRREMWRWYQDNPIRIEHREEFDKSLEDYFKQFPPQGIISGS